MMHIWKKWIDSKHRALASGAASVVLLGAAALAWWVGSAPLPSPEAPPRDLVLFASSDRFADLSEEKKQPYIDALMKIPPQELFAAAREADLSPEQRRAGMENVMMARWTKSLDDYFALPPGKERVAHLDRLIDEQEKQRARWSSQRAASGRGNRDASQPSQRRAPNATGGRRDFSQRWADPARQKRRIENMPPARRAQMAEYMAAMRARRLERGLNVPSRR